MTYEPSHYILEGKFLEMIDCKTAGEALQLGYDGEIKLSILLDAPLPLMIEEELSETEVDRLLFSYRGYLGLLKNTIRQLQIEAPTHSISFSLSKDKILRDGYIECDEGDDDQKIPEGNLASSVQTVAVYVDTNRHSQQGIAIRLSDVIVCHEDYVEWLLKKQPPQEEYSKTLGRPSFDWIVWEKLLQEQLQKKEVSIDEKAISIAKKLVLYVENLETVEQAKFMAGKKIPKPKTVAQKIAKSLAYLKKNR